MTEVIYTCGQRVTTAISDVCIQGLEVWQNRQLSNKATWQQPVICEYTRSNPPLPCRAVCCLIFFTKKNKKEIWKATRCLDGWKGMSFSVFHICATQHWCDCTDTKPVCFDTTPACFSLCPFALPGPKVFGWLSHKTLLKPWQANYLGKDSKRVDNP